MHTLLWLFIWIIGLGTLCYFRIARQPSTIAILIGLVVTTLFSGASWITVSFLWITLGALLVLLNHEDYRSAWVTQPLFTLIKRALPSLSETEKTAIDAGTTGWDAELFSGQPDWSKLKALTPATLTAEERAFLEGPVETVCRMVTDWEVHHQLYDLPQSVWQYLREEGFFAMVIPKQYGGLDFSAYAHSEVLTKLSGRNLTLASTVSVPNSLGPAELILHYGTQAQKDYYLPRLAQGIELPCFALTGAESGSDAAAMPDTGIVSYGIYEGQETLGIRLNWDKRYITLAPVATLLGLAFKLYDPDHLLGQQESLGITCALIPTHLPGVKIGQRHMPFIPFQNGPTQGQNVFIPLEAIIGGKTMIGQGWRMLVERLSIGRGISLPASRCCSASMAALTTGAYAHIRRQFKTPLVNFEGIQSILGQMGGLVYLAESARTLICRFIDQGEKPAVLGAIVKYHLTEIGRLIGRQAMDIHAGKALMLGPKNYLAQGYQGAPIGITVEGANILTRNMIIFGQGGIRCHPFILKELEAIENNDLQAFESLLGQHAQHMLANAFGSLFHGLTFGYLSSSPGKGKTRHYYQQLNRASRAFALISDTSMALLGGRLKFKENLSARLGDLLSYLFLASAALKRYDTQGEPASDWPLVSWSCEYCLSSFWQTVTHLLQNFPNRWVAMGLRVVVMPLGASVTPPSDQLNQKIARLLSTENDARNRLMKDCYISKDTEDEVHCLMQAFKASLATSEIHHKVLQAQKTGEIPNGTLSTAISAARSKNILSEAEAQALEQAYTLMLKVIAVDTFPSDTFKGKPIKTENENIAQPQGTHSSDHNSNQTLPY